MAYELEERLVENVQTKEQKVNIKKYRKYREFKSYMHTLKRLVYVQSENHMERKVKSGEVEIIIGEIMTTNFHKPKLYVRQSSSQGGR